ncbi:MULTISPECIES: archaea-specific SMC-related protein [Halobaculum]|uniref:Chromosome segregation protein SMC n=2 Tax=Halobaculum TaxID=43927 RepID=A0A8T8WHY3_9EURY|nr:MULTISPECIES: archaea-specific SMC-related protein [Halobaculum]QZP39396.1 chromosome segregation protein SMC [Halobaculum magnesiiphilum]QZY04206.1 chromosome segregation protein SMC [Halobaculum roseum]
MESDAPVEVGSTLHVEQIGGIQETTVSLVPGVNVLEGRNATNRTSFLRAIMAALGSTDVSLKGDAKRGIVELEIGPETYTRTLERKDGTTTFGGDPYLDDPTLADRFAFLLESNEARRSVARGDDLREVIMDPVDTKSIEQEIENTESRRAEIDERIEELKGRKSELTSLQSERREIQSTLTDKRSALEDVREEITEADTAVDEMQKRQEEHQEALTELEEARERLSNISDRIEDEREQLEALENERSELREEREEFPTSFEEISEIGRKTGELQERRRSLGSLVDRIQNIVQFNNELLDDADSDLRDALVAETEDPTDQLLEEPGLQCWTCGSVVDREEIEERLSDLRALRREKMEERREISAELDELQDRKRRMEKHQQRREQIDQQLQQIEERLSQNRTTIDELQDERATLRDRVQEAERAVESLEPDDNERVLELNRRETELEVTIERLKSELSEIDDRIEEVEEAVAEIPELEAERETVNQRLAELRTRIEDLERQAVTGFNDHMEQLIDRLGYENIERIWIERRSLGEGETRRGTSETQFDLHVVRTTAEGTAYEDTVSHLSESEREVTGLVFALAGYLVHDVHELVPFMLLDSLEAIDADRIAAVVEYFKEYTDYLVVALLPGDAAAVNDGYNRVTTI